MSSQFVSIGDLKNISGLAITSKENLISYFSMKLLAMMFSWITSESKLCWPQISVRNVILHQSIYYQEVIFDKQGSFQDGGFILIFPTCSLRGFGLSLNFFPVEKQ